MPLITSISFMTGTGFMKCIPITWWALWGMHPPIFVIEIDEVLEASIECSGVQAARFSKIFFFNAKFSVAASIVKSEFFNSLIASAYCILERNNYLSSMVILFF